MSFRESDLQYPEQESDDYHDYHSNTARNPNYLIPPVISSADSYYNPYPLHSYPRNSYSPRGTFHQFSLIIAVDGRERQYMSTSYRSLPQPPSAPRQPSSHYSRGNYPPEERLYSYPVHQLSEHYQYDNAQHYEDRNPDRRWFRPVSIRNVANQIPRQNDQRALSYSYGKTWFFI